MLHQHVLLVWKRELWQCGVVVVFFFFKQKTAYEVRISDWSSDVCSSDLGSDVVGVVVETKCNFRKELSFPEVVDAGLRVKRLANSSVTYEIGLFKECEADASAVGHFVHVYFDRVSRRPVPVPDFVCKALHIGSAHV